MFRGLVAIYMFVDQIVRIKLGCDEGGIGWSSTTLHFFVTALKNVACMLRLHYGKVFSYLARISLLLDCMIISILVRILRTILAPFPAEPPFYHLWNLCGTFEQIWQSVAVLLQSGLYSVYLLLFRSCDSFDWQLLLLLLHIQSC